MTSVHRSHQAWHLKHVGWPIQRNSQAQLPAFPRESSTARQVDAKLKAAGTGIGIRWTEHAVFSTQADSAQCIVRSQHAFLAAKASTRAFCPCMPVVDPNSLASVRSTSRCVGMGHFLKF